MTSSVDLAAETATPSPRATHVGAAIVALALGGFAIGTTEFVTMGLLKEIAVGIDESIPTTGHVITAYAFGVVVGAPIIVALGARLPRRELAVGLILALGVGNAVTALASGYVPVLAARFLAGLPHGAYFGVASLLAASLVPAHRRGRAVSRVMLGLSVATVAGVPAATWLGQAFGWRAAYWAVVVLAVLAAAMMLLFVPHQPGDRTASMRGELSALKRPQVLFAVTAGMVGFGGLFAMYSYVAPIVTDVTGLADATIPWFLLAFGVGSVLGSWLAGPLADWDVPRLVIGGFIATVVVLVLFHQTAGMAVWAALGVFAIGALGSLVAIGLQIRLMDAAGDAQMLGAALNHSALNIANGLGAWLGGVVIAAGYGYRAPSLVGAGLAIAGLVIFVVGLGAQRRSRGAASEASPAAG
ncbi:MULTISPECIES: MFS transporter [unclassified Aeromicrobium]|uniref:MFS transporter n=1 Tax=unclassified Aeromicrobium TaxID=2633570 RepID=UPI0006F98045|nr:MULTISPECIES: MFS transporter [unclassified Aeromicrobium]KQO42045.1 MFS transporter [Aeromicrobium sp. Leaf245]KQP81416.1 MFS transporter [Aeromicrobium sp. Leaf291]